MDSPALRAASFGQLAEGADCVGADSRNGARFAALAASGTAVELPPLMSAGWAIVSDSPRSSAAGNFGASEGVFPELPNSVLEFTIGGAVS